MLCKFLKCNGPSINQWFIPNRKVLDVLLYKYSSFSIVAILSVSNLACMWHVIRVLHIKGVPTITNQLEVGPILKN